MAPRARHAWLVLSRLYGLRCRTSYCSRVLPLSENGSGRNEKQLYLRELRTGFATAEISCWRASVVAQAARLLVGGGPQVLVNASQLSHSRKWLHLIQAFWAGLSWQTRVVRLRSRLLQFGLERAIGPGPQPAGPAPVGKAPASWVLAVHLATTSASTNTHIQLVEVVNFSKQSCGHASAVQPSSVDVAQARTCSPAGSAAVGAKLGLASDKAHWPCV